MTLISECDSETLIEAASPLAVPPPRRREGWRGNLDVRRMATGWASRRVVALLKLAEYLTPVAFFALVFVEGHLLDRVREERANTTWGGTTLQGGLEVPRGSRRACRRTGGALGP